MPPRSPRAALTGALAHLGARVLVGDSMLVGALALGDARAVVGTVAVGGARVLACARSPAGARLLFGARVLACALAFGGVLMLGAGPAAAAEPYDPIAQGIDGVCDAYLPSAAPRDIVILARIPQNDGSVPIWRRSDSATRTGSQSAPDFPGGDFATAIFDRGGIVFADIVHIDAQSTATQTPTWCFIGGKLSRATIDIFDAQAAVGWGRRSYYGDDLTKPLSERIAPASPTQPDARARPPLDMLIVDPFATPAKLPFYDPAVAAHTANKPRT